MIWHDVKSEQPPTGQTLRITVPIRKEFEAITPYVPTVLGPALSGQLGSLGPDSRCETVVVLGHRVYFMDEILEWAYWDQTNEPKRPPPT